MRQSSSLFPEGELYGGEHISSHIRKLKSGSFTIIGSCCVPCWHKIPSSCLLIAAHHYISTLSRYLVQDTSASTVVLRRGTVHCGAVSAGNVANPETRRTGAGEYRAVIRGQARIGNRHINSRMCCHMCGYYRERTAVVLVQY